jgi:hypothetical protein
VACIPPARVGASHRRSDKSIHRRLKWFALALLPVQMLCCDTTPHRGLRCPHALCSDCALQLVAKVTEPDTCHSHTTPVFALADHCQTPRCCQTPTPSHPMYPIQIWASRPTPSRNNDAHTLSRKQQPCFTYVEQFIAR